MFTDYFGITISLGQITSQDCPVDIIQPISVFVPSGQSEIILGGSNSNSSVSVKGNP